MPNKILFGLAATAAILLSACGDEVTEVTEVNEVGMMVIEKGEALPKCTSDNEGALVYSVDSAQAYYCVSRKWKTLNGKDGADGKDGEKGDKGDQGEQGVKGDTGEKGEQGEKGEVGASCTVEQLPDSIGYKVLCDGDSIGVVLNGEKGDKGEKGDQGVQGEQGPQGEKGDTGSNGSSCNIFDEGHGVLTITCNDGKNSRSSTFYKAVCGTSPYDPEEIAPIYCNNGNFHLKDSRDGQSYRIVTIGNQIWMAENLNFKTAKSRCYHNSIEYCAEYGRFYTWAEAVDSAAVFSSNAKGCGNGKTCTIKTPARGICPEGWHIPDTTEWNTLYSAIGKSAKDLLVKDFYDLNDATDKYGFSAFPIVSCNELDCDYVGVAFLWSITEDYSDNRLVHSWVLNETIGYTESLNKTNGIPVRCLKD